MRHCPNFTSTYHELMSVLHSILSVLNVKALVGAFNVQPGEGPHGFNEIFIPSVSAMRSAMRSSVWTREACWYGGECG